MNHYLHRKRALHAAYSLWPNATEACAYCGVYGDTYDHVPPLAFVHSLGLSHFEEQRIRLFLVPACRECNSLLVGCPSHTVTARRITAKAKLKRRYNKALAIPRWDQSQLDELGYNLRVMVEAGVNIKDWIKRRLAF